MPIASRAATPRRDLVHPAGAVRPRYVLPDYDDTYKINAFAIYAARSPGLVVSAADARLDDLAGEEVTRAHVREELPLVPGAPCRTG